MKRTYTIEVPATFYFDVVANDRLEAAALARRLLDGEDPIENFACSVVDTAAIKLWKSDV